MTSRQPKITDKYHSNRTHANRHDDDDNLTPSNSSQKILILPAADSKATDSKLRSYQSDCVYSCLKANTLVVLPTGLGKTLIASCVLHNLHRWYPDARLIFTAPTKPLVKQQWQACMDSVGIEAKHMACMTGSSIFIWAIIMKERIICCLRF